MIGTVNINTFDTSEEVATALANAVSSELSRAIRERGRAVLALSGGETPKRFLELLATKRLDWQHTIVTLVDERWVPPSNTRSNQRLITERLLTKTSRPAQFEPLFNGESTPEQGVKEIERRLAKVLDQGFDVVVLGMGLDGHIASLFPGTDCLTDALTPDGNRLIVPTKSTDANEPRISLTLSALLRTKNLFLQIEGDAKAQVFFDAQLGRDIANAPVKAVLRQTKAPINVFLAR